MLRTQVIIKIDERLAIKCFYYIAIDVLILLQSYGWQRRLRKAEKEVVAEELII